jgi:hypothetical protein
MPIMPIIKKQFVMVLLQNDKKIEELNSFTIVSKSITVTMPCTNWQTYVASGKQDLALKTFDRLISEFKTDLTLQNQFCVKDYLLQL